MNINIFIKKIKNSYLTPRFDSLDFEKLYKSENFFYKILIRFFWFVPNNSQSKYWIKANEIGHGYEQFIKIDELGKIITNKIREYAKKEDSILDICCNAGRILNELESCGYKNLNGFDINIDAINNSKKIFKNLRNAALTCSSAEKFLRQVECNFYDITYSLGATLELIPPHFDIIKHISRITKKYFICLINENGHAYPRFWKKEFKKNFFLIKENVKIGENRTLFVLKKIS